MLSPSEVKVVLEAALLTADAPVTIADMRKLFDEEVGADTIRRLLDEIRCLGEPAIIYDKECTIKCTSDKRPGD